MIAKADIKKLSVLARVELLGKEEEDLARDLGAILGYFDKLKGISTRGLRDETKVADRLANLRNDEQSAAVFEDSLGLIAAAPESNDGYVKVKAVFQR